MMLADLPYLLVHVGKADQRDSQLAGKKLDFFGNIAYITRESKVNPNSQVTERQGGHYGNDGI